VGDWLGVASKTRRASADHSDAFDNTITSGSTRGPTTRSISLMDASNRDRLKALAQKEGDRHRATLVALSHAIHRVPELAFEEHHAVDQIVSAIQGRGLAIRRPAFDIETAFVAEFGPGPFTVAICAEYDALPGIGHACGHNVIAASAVGAALALIPVAKAAGLRVRLLGTPAEEIGNNSGKIMMIDRGAFEGVDAALMVHPAPFDVAQPMMIAAATFDIEYVGKAAHAAFFPELGVNAADAMVIAVIAVNALRQHIRATDRLHGIITSAGSAPNIIPERSTGRFMARSRTLTDLQSLRDRMLNCFEAGAIATGCQLRVTGGNSPYADVIHDPLLSSLYRRNAEALGRIFDDGPEQVDRPSGSTDMGNVSHAVPSIHPFIGIECFPAVNHQPEFALASATPAADRAILDAAVAMAWTSIDAAAESQV
jgi:amidohydrolase